MSIGFRVWGVWGVWGNRGFGEGVSGCRNLRTERETELKA